MPKTTNQTPHIFICYGRKESTDFVKRLSNDLCYMLDDKNAVWYDTLMSADKQWLAEIQRQLSLRKVFILIASPNALRSPYVQDEFQLAWIGKNKKTSAQKKFIVLHFRECMNEIPKELEFIRLCQWVQCFPPMTYRSVLEEIFKAINISLDTRANQFLNTLDALDLAVLVRPKASTDFSSEEREEQLKVLGKFVYLFYQQERWDDVVTCADEALSFEPNDRNLLDIKQKAKEQLKLIQQSRQGGSTNRIGNTISSSHNDNRTTQDALSSVPMDVSPTAIRPPQSKPQSAKPNFSRATAHHSSQSSSINGSSPKKTSHFEDTSKVNANDFSQPLTVKGTSRFSSLITNSSPSYFKNFADFISRLIHQRNRFLQTICLIDVIIIPILLGLRLQADFVLVFLVGLLLSFLAIIVAPVTKDRKVVFIPIIFFSLSWISIGVFLVWFINQLFLSMFPVSSKATLQLDNNFVIVFGALSFLCGFSVHLLVTFNTDYIEEIVVPKPARKRSRR
jgi:hypothetical protein